MADIDESKIPSVRQVCQDFRVREDESLAHRLQEEEFGNHYIRNRSERKTVREDVKAAKITYLEEVKHSQILPEDMVHNMERTEHWLAIDLQHKLQNEEIECERRRRDAETRDEAIARQMQEKEALKLERARQRRLERQRQEEQENTILNDAISHLTTNGENHVNHYDPPETQTAARNGPPVKEDMRPHPKLTGKGSNSSRGSENGYYQGDGAAVVQLPPPAEGGRLESDRIIMADGTAIDLFDENDDVEVREKAHKRSREKQDEEFARKLQEEEKKMLEQDRQAANDRRVALEYQDREFARELQRREYVRLQKLKRERQLRRAQTVPAESTSGGSTGELQSHQRLPSYDEAVQREPIPDLLQDDSLHQKQPSPRRDMNTQPDGSFERRDKATKRISQASSYGSQSSTSASLERESLRHQQDYRLSESPNHSPLSSLDGSLERTEGYIRQNSHRSSTSSSHSASNIRPVQSPTSPDTREAVWERLYEEGDDIPRHSRHQRIVERRTTVASSSPSNHLVTELQNSGRLRNGTDCNIAELIDPTFNRKTQNNNEASPPSTLGNPESKPKPVALIQPQRRRNSDKKKKEKEKECKQQ